MTNFDRLEAIPETTGKEWISIAYMRAICAQAGLNIKNPGFDNGIDLDVHSVKSINGCLANNSIAIQLKATKNWNVESNGIIKYDLPVKNYNILRARSLYPQYLVLFTLPSAYCDWIKYQFEDESHKHVIEFRHMAYYINLDGFPETSNKETIKIEIPISNRLTSKELISLFDKHGQEMATWVHNQKGAI